MRIVGVDIGGTFTDFMLYDTESGSAHVHKVRSTPDDPERALVEGLRELCGQAGVPAASLDGVFHGTTVATNAVLEHRGAVCGLVTTEGFRDVVHIGRHQRPQHYSVMQDIPWQARPFVKRRHRKVVPERVVPPAGEVLVPLDEDAVRAAARELREEGVEAVAVCFLFSYLNPANERRAAEIVAEELPGAFVTASADIFPQFREFERFTTACMNAFVGPGTGRYLERLAGALRAEGVTSGLHVMMSNGGVASARTAAEKPVTLLLSGPAAGVLGGVWTGELSGRQRLITFDMGGTSADIGIVTERGITEASARDTEVARVSAARPDDRHPHDRGRGWLDRPRRRGRRIPRRAAERRRSAGAGVLRPRRQRSRPSPTPTSCSDGSTPNGSSEARWRSSANGRCRPCRRSGAAARARRARGGGGHRHDRECRHGEGDPVADRPEGPRSARRSRSSPSAAPVPCTPARSRTRSGFRRSSSPRTRGSPRRPAS